MGRDQEAPAGGNGDLGRRVQQYRHLVRMPLRQLAESADVSASFLSQLENGHSSASIATLARIATALNVTIADLFDTGTVGPKPLSPAERPVLRAENNVRKALLTRVHLDGMGVYAAEFDPGGSTGPEQYSHSGTHEVVVVLRGEMVVELHQDRHVLRAGDSIDFDSSRPHRLLNDSAETAEVHWIVGPAQPAP
ncbi:MAG: helix-turn-helix domain-containing protein, partial [Micromonosporaceae bacterium]